MRGAGWWVFSVSAYAASLVCFTIAVPDEVTPLRILNATFLVCLPPALALWLVIELRRRP